MPPRRRPRTRNSTPAAPTPPPGQMDAAAIATLVAEQVAAALANFSTNRGTGNGSGSSNVNNNGSNPRACSYKDFSNCKPKTFYGDGGVIALTRWFEKMESVFEICSCPDEFKVKYAACTFADSALSWWNSEVKTMTLVVANAMSWDELKIMMVEEYCPRGEIQNLEQEFWNLSMKGSDLTAYVNRFNDLAVLCPQMVDPEYKKVERFIWGLAPEIQGMVVASRPTTFLSAKTIAQRLIDQCVRQGTMENKPDPPQRGDNKRKKWGNEKDKSQQGPLKKQQTVAVHAITAPTAPAAPAPPKVYSGNLPKCDKCNFHHVGACRELHCTNCNRKGHTARSCRAPAQTTTQTTPAAVSHTCYECGEAGHFKKDCPRARNVGGD